MAASVEGWYECHGTRLMAFAYLVAQDRADAEDAVQAAMAATIPRWDSIHAGAKYTYLKRAIVNHLVSEGRRQARFVGVSFDDLAREPRPAGVPDPVDRVALADAAWRLCRTLPINQRAALVMRFYDDASYEQIAASLECSLATARSHVHRALASLQAGRVRTPEGDPA